MPPCPRTNSTMIHLQQKNIGLHMLVIYGGRNDNIFSMTNNVALNDICIFNLNKFTWETVAMFGQMPCSRWSHCMVARGYEQMSSDGFMIFGGVNLQNYCKSTLYNFQLSDVKLPKKEDNKQQKQKAPIKLFRADSSNISNRHTKLSEEVKKRIIILQDICNDPRIAD